MFEIGSRVVYRAEGVCVITDIRKEAFGAASEERRYYVLAPEGDNRSTVFVPTDNQKLTDLMRPLMSAEEIERMAKELREERMERISDSKARSAALRETLSIGERRSLCVMINTLSEKLEQLVKKQKKPCSTDLSALKKAENLLFDEFSATTDIASPDDVIPVLRGEKKLSPKPISLQKRDFADLKNLFEKDVKNILTKRVK